MLRTGVTARAYAALSGRFKEREAAGGAAVRTPFSQLAVSPCTAVRCLVELPRFRERCRGARRCRARGSPGRRAAAQRQDVADAHQPARGLHLVAIDADMAGEGELLGGGAGPGEAGVPQPFVDALRRPAAAPSFALALLQLALQCGQRGEGAVRIDRALAAGRSLRSGAADDPPGAASAASSWRAGVGTARLPGQRGGRGRLSRGGGRGRDWRARLGGALRPARAGLAASPPGGSPRRLRAPLGRRRSGRRLLAGGAAGRCRAGRQTSIISVRAADGCVGRRCRHCRAAAACRQDCGRRSGDPATGGLFGRRLLRRAAPRPAAPPAAALPAGGSSPAARSAGSWTGGSSTGGSAAGVPEPARQGRGDSPSLPRSADPAAGRCATASAALRAAAPPASDAAPCGSPAPAGYARNRRRRRRAATSSPGVTVKPRPSGIAPGGRSPTAPGRQARAGRIRSASRSRMSMRTARWP